MLDCIKPGPDEIVISKTSCSVFRATNINRVLQNLGVRHLILAGCLTDQCVESAVRDACDSNYFVTVVTGMYSKLLISGQACINYPLLQVRADHGLHHRGEFAVKKFKMSFSSKTFR